MLGVGSTAATKLIQYSPNVIQPYVIQVMCQSCSREVPCIPFDTAESSGIVNVALDLAFENRVLKPAWSALHCRTPPEDRHGVRILRNPSPLIS